MRGERGGKEGVGGALCDAETALREIEGPWTHCPPGGSPRAGGRPPAHSLSVSLRSRPLGALDPLATLRKATGSWLHLSPRL